MEQMGAHEQILLLLTRRALEGRKKVAPGASPGSISITEATLPLCRRPQRRRSRSGLFALPVEDRCHLLRREQNCPLRRCAPSLWPSAERKWCLKLSDPGARAPGYCLSPLPGLCRQRGFGLSFGFN